MQRRPLSCPFCLSVWIGVLMCPFVGTVWPLPLGVLTTMLVANVAPWIYDP